VAQLAGEASAALRIAQKEEEEAAMVRFGIEDQQRKQAEEAYKAALAAADAAQHEAYEATRQIGRKKAAKASGTEIRALEREAAKAAGLLEEALDAASAAREVFDREREEAAMAAVQRSESDAQMAAVAKEQADETVTTLRIQKENALQRLDAAKGTKNELSIKLAEEELVHLTEDFCAAEADADKAAERLATTIKFADKAKLDKERGEARQADEEAKAAEAKVSQHENKCERLKQSLQDARDKAAKSKQLADKRKATDIDSQLKEAQGDTVRIKAEAMRLRTVAGQQADDVKRTEEEIAARGEKTAVDGIGGVAKVARRGGVAVGEDDNDA